MRRRPIDLTPLFHLGTDIEVRCIRLGVCGRDRIQKGKKMSKSSFKGSLLATTVIAGMALATPAFAQSQTTPENVPPAPVTPTNTQGNTAPAAPTDALPAAGTQSNESAAPAE